MKLKINRLSINFMLASMLIAAKIPTFSIINNDLGFSTPVKSRNFIHIESDTQILDVRGNIITFIGNVVITQEKIKINADKVIITRQNNERGKEVIDSYGNPVTFHQIQDGFNKTIKGYASKIYYELAKDLIVLTGNAYLEQLDSNITGNKIIYSVKEKKMKVYGEKGKRVTTVLVPSQLQGKDRLSLLNKK